MTDRVTSPFRRIARSLRSASASSGHYGQAAWSMLGNSGQQVLSFGIFALLARFLDPRQIGLIAICHLINQGVRTIVIDSLAIPTTRKPDLSDDDASWSFTFISSVAIVFALAMIAGADVVDSLFRAPGLAPVLRAMSLVVIISGLSRVYESRLVRTGAYRLLALRSLCAIAAGGFVAVPLAIHGYGVWALVGQQLTYETVQLLIAALSERRRWTPRLVWNAERLRWNIRESMTLFAGAAPTFAAANADAALVSVLFGPTQLGFYSFAKRILSAIYLAGGVSISAVGFTQYIRFQADVVAVRGALAHNVRLSFFILISAYLCLSLTITPAIGIVFGAKWLGALSLFPVLIAASLFQLLWTQCASLLLALGEPRRIAQLSALQLVLLLVFALVVSRYAAFGAPLFGPLPFGAISIGLAVLLSTMVCSLWLALLTIRRIELSTRRLVMTVLPSLAAAALVFAGADLLAPATIIAESLVRLVLVSIVILATYAALTWLIGSVGIVKRLAPGDA